MQKEINILAVDTSSSKFCLGIVNRKGKTAEYNLLCGIRHTELFLPTVRKALRRLRLSIDEIDCFAVGLGPGSFTGLRISLAFTKGFALALKRPIVGLPTLDVIARNCTSEKRQIVCPVIDARRNLVYTALYEAGGNRSLKRLSPYLLIGIDELIKRARPYESVSFLGDGLSLYQQRIRQRIKGSLFLGEDNWYPEAGRLISLARELIDRGRFIDARRIKPIYLYPKECQIQNALKDR